MQAREITRAALREGDVVDGPAIIVEDETSTVVTSAFRALQLGDGCLLIACKEAR